MGKGPIETRSAKVIFTSLVPVICALFKGDDQNPIKVWSLQKQKHSMAG